MHNRSNVVFEGAPLESAEIAILAIHGRGATSDSILSLSQYLPFENAVWIAPQATSNTWYPYSFMAPFEHNQPHLDSALELVHQLLDEIDTKGPGLDKTFVFGFSQGGCLALESVARYKKHVAGVAGLSSGLIGPEGTQWGSNPSLENTQVFIGCADPDSHIPVNRVHESEAFFAAQKANVTAKIYPNGGHTINEDEIKHVKHILSSLQS